MKRDPGRELLSRLLWAAGVLIGGLSGMCTGVGLVVALTSAPTTALQFYDNLSVPLMFGGLPLGLGGAAIVLSGPVMGSAPRRRLAGAALAVGVLILAATVPDLVYVIVHGPDRMRSSLDLGGRSEGTWLTVRLAALGAAALLAAALYESRRRPPV